MKAIVIPAGDEPVYEIELDGGQGLAKLQDAVGGYIQALPLPAFIKGGDKATAYVNEEGKFDPECKPNMRATDFMVPAIGLHPGDYIAGSFVLVGFDIRTGRHTDEMPQAVLDRVELIKRESSA